MLLYRPGCRCRRIRLGAKCQSAAFHIGTGDVHLNQVHPSRRNLFAELGILLQGIAGDVGNDLRPLLPEPGHFLLAKGIHTGILQPNAVENAGGRFCNPGAGISVPALHGQSLDADAAQVFKRKILRELPSKAKGTGCHHHGIFQLDSRQLDAHISHPRSHPLPQTPGHPYIHVPSPLRRSSGSSPRTPDMRQCRSPSAPPWTHSREPLPVSPSHR